MKKLICGLLLLLSFEVQSQQNTIIAGVTNGIDQSGNIIPIAVNGRPALDTIAHISNGVYTTGWLARNQFIGAQSIVFSDVNGSYTIEYSENNGATLSMPTVTVPYIQGATRVGLFSINAAYVKFTYTNGNIAQTKFKFEIRFLTDVGQGSFEILGARGADTRLAGWNKTVNETKDGPTGTYEPIYRTGNSLNVNVTNPTTISFPSIQQISGSVLVNNLDTSVTVTSLPPVVIANTSIPVTGTFYQSIQPINGAVSVTNPYLVSSNDSSKYRKFISIDNQPANPATSILQNSNIGLLNDIKTLLTNGITTNSTPYLPYYFNYLSTSGIQIIKTTTGTIGSIEIANPSSADLYIQIFATTGTVTLGTTVPTWYGHIDATLGKLFFNNSSGILFTNGIKYAITTTYNGNGTPSSPVGISIGFK